MPQIQSVSVLLPARQGGPLLARVLDSLAQQECECAWDVHVVVDSAAAGGTAELLEQARARFPVPLSVRSVHALEHDAGDTRNQLAAESRGELLVYLPADAVPLSRDWLAQLVRHFEDPRVGAAYCRNVPRPDAGLLDKLFCAGERGCGTASRRVCLPPPWIYAQMDVHQRRLHFDFGAVASAVRRELWERHPFPRTESGEDVLMARALLEAGLTVVYDAAAAVEHGGELDAGELRARAVLEGRFDAEWLGHIRMGSREQALEWARRQLERDQEALSGAGLRGESLARELERARALREAWALGLHEGGCSPRRHGPSRMLATRHLHVLYVVHGFPPDTWAGTEVYTLELAREMQRLGHRVTILARTPGGPGEDEGGPAEFSLLESEFQGLPVWRMVHRLQHTRLSQSYDEPRAAAAFAELLARVMPDLVHFQHLIHTSVGLVHVARAAGVPTVLHCHDFWPICARVQMVRPDGVRCESNQGAGCFLCIRERGLEHIPRVRAVGASHPEALQERARGLRRGQPLPERAQHFWEGLDALLERQEVVMGAVAAADLRVSPSRFLREKLLADGRLDPQRLVFSDNGMRTDHVAALEKQPDAQRRLRVGFVGSLVWYKGTDVLVRALAQLRDQPVTAEIFGDYQPQSDAYHAQLRELAAGLPSVRFHGRFENQRLSEVYAGLDVLVVPSVWYENAPITIREAFLTRTPVVTSALGGMAESVRDGVDGLHFAPGDAADLARVLRRLLEEPGLLERLARGAPRVKSMAENARETEFRYRGLVAGKDRPWSLLLERSHGEHVACEGEILANGSDLTLLLPGASAQYELAAAGPGRRIVELELLTTGAKPGIPIGARVFLDGAAVGALEVPAAAGEGGVRCARLDLDLGPTGGRLRLVASGAEDARPAQLPLRRVRVYGLPSPASFARSPYLPPRLAGQPLAAPPVP